VCPPGAFLSIRYQTGAYRRPIGPFSPMRRLHSCGHTVGRCDRDGSFRQLSSAPA
jgi:hypothetical protein